MVHPSIVNLSFIKENQHFQLRDFMISSNEEIDKTFDLARAWISVEPANNRANSAGALRSFFTRVR